MPKESRASMVASAASLIAAKGVASTSFSEVVGDSGAPRGSIYHHFPGGKNQLTADAIALTSERVLGYLQAGPTESPHQVLAHFIALWRRVVVASGGRSGCAVAGVAVDTDQDNDLMQLVRRTFEDWTNELAKRLTTAGLAPERSMPIAQTTLASMEGALILCRAEGGPGPIDAIAEELLRLVG